MAAVRTVVNANASRGCGTASPPFSSGRVGGQPDPHRGRAATGPSVVREQRNHDRIGAFGGGAVTLVRPAEVGRMGAVSLDGAGLGRDRRVDLDLVEADAVLLV